MVGFLLTLNGGGGTGVCVHVLCILVTALEFCSTLVMDIA